MFMSFKSKNFLSMLYQKILLTKKSNFETEILVFL